MAFLVYIFVLVLDDILFHRTTMKTRTSIQFDAMSGTAGEVTARSTRFGTILSGRARQPGKITPQQKDMRALFARVGRSFKQLTSEQVGLWSEFALQYSFGNYREAKSPAVNAYVTLNCNRALLGYSGHCTSNPGYVLY